MGKAKRIKKQKRSNAYQAKLERRKQRRKEALLRDQELARKLLEAEKDPEKKRKRLAELSQMIAILGAM